MCPLGEYQPNGIMSYCEKCPEGFYCPRDSNLDVDGVTIRTAGEENRPDRAIRCPKGKYCPKGSHAPTDCGLHFYMPFEGSNSAVDCIPCLAGKRCTGTATWDWENNSQGDMNDCSTGMYCPTGSTVELDCDPGHYCEAGSGTMTACWVGEYNDDANSSTDVCQPCPVNKFCGSRGMKSTEAGLCGNGFSCGAGSMAQEPTSNQNGSLCQAGEKCSVLTEGSEDCESGYYQPNEGQSSCLACPVGHLCTDTGYGPSALTLRPVPCPAGSYCPAPTAIVTNEEVPCKNGYYSGIEGAGE